MSAGRYLVTPLGLSYDDLTQAAIVATSKGNAGSVVVDQNTGITHDAKTLKALVAALRKKPLRQPVTQTLGFNFESEQGAFPLLSSLITG